MTDDAAGRIDDLNAVVDLAQHVLDTYVAVFDAADRELPKRREIVIGELVVEDEGSGRNAGVFGVMYGGHHVGAPGNEMSAPLRGDAPTTGVFNIELWRPVTTTGGGGARRAPKASVITDQAKEAMIDSWLLMRAAYACDHWDATDTIPDWDGPGVIASVAPLPPQGGLQGMNVSLSLQVP